MLKTIKIEKPYHGKTEITAREAVRIQYESHSSYSFGDYVRDIMREFKATKEEAEAVVREELKLKK